METAKPDIDDAQRFATAVHESAPHQMLAYNLSPSFNWSDPAIKLADDDIRAFQQRIGEFGYVFQFITLAGLHANALAITHFTRAFASEYMLAYVNEIQRKEQKLDVPILRHQKWSGAELIDRQTAAAISGSGILSTTAMGHANTERQFDRVLSKL